MPGSGLEVARGFAFKKPGFEIPGDVRPAGAEGLDDQWQVGQFTAAVRARVPRDDLLGERGTDERHPDPEHRPSVTAADPSLRAREEPCVADPTQSRGACLVHRHVLRSAPPTT